MRRIITAITAVALALSFVASATTVNAAVPGYDSAYAGESAFLTLNPGQSGTFTAFFANTGTTSWVRGTASQVDLAACLENKTSCNLQDASEAPFNSGWLSAVRYTTHTQTTVAPGQIGTFTYNVAVPAAQAPGTYRFNGALVLSATGADIHNEGYYQDVTVPVRAAAAAAPAVIDLVPASQFRQIGKTATLTLTATDAAGAAVASVAVTCNIDSIAGTSPDAITGNPDFQVTGTTNASGVFVLTFSRDNPGIDTVTCYSDADPTVRDVSTVQWGIPAVPLAVTPDTAETKAVGECRTYTVQAFNPLFGGPLTPTGVADNPSLQLYANFTENFAAPTGIDKDAGATITDSAGNSFSPSPTLSVPVVTDANGVALLSVCGVGVATLTPIVFNNQSGGNVNTIQAADLRDTGGTLTIGFLATATITPSAATNPTSTAGAASFNNAGMTDEAGEETYTLTLRQAGATFLVPNDYTVIFTVRNTSVDTIVYIVNCDGTDVSIAVIGGGTATCTATIAAGENPGTASVTVDSAQVGGASITATATSTSSPFTQTTSNTATKSWVTTADEDTAFAVNQSRSGTVTSVEKGASANDCVGSYILTVGTTAYLITYDLNDSFVVGGVTFLGLPACTQFEASLSAGDLLTFTNVGADPGSVDIHNITQDNP
ncbi:MAG: hypothetical protein H0U35_05470 [Sporichthyaceae bacterium]|nr:hypothetical protein [Sporichthyaceae bacterium]